MEHRIAHADSKNVTPRDSNSFSVSQLSKEMIDKHYNKPITGHVIISDAKTGEVLETPNLVLLGGREFVAQKIADLAANVLIPNTSSNGETSSINLANYKIRYFGVGSGGASVSNALSKIGPYDDDTNLRAPASFGTKDSVNYPYDYLHGGKLKRIEADGGKIEIVAESHTITNSVNISAMTTIKYTMYIERQEISRPFLFNEASLYAVEYAGDVPASPNSNDSTTSGYAANYRAFARFTTSTKVLDTTDSLKIEWFILT